MTKNKLIAFSLPVLFSLYPVLALAAHNLSEMDLADAYRSFFLAIVFAFLTFSLAYLFSRNVQLSALYSVVLILLFFSYGHIYDLLRETTIFGVFAFRHRILALIWIASLVLGIYVVSRSNKDYRQLIQVFGLVAAVSLLPPLWEISNYQLRAIDIEKENRANASSLANQTNAEKNKNLPSIYYIILDAYSREDYLREYFEYDNSYFIDWLGDRGFLIPNCTQSNYSQSVFSITSTLNMDYIEGFYQESYENDYQGNKYKQNMINHLKQSRVRSFLEENGYTTVAFETGDAFSEITDADVYYSKENKTFWQWAFSGLNEFEVLLVRSSALSFLSAVSPSIAEYLLPDLDFPNKTHRERILFAFDVLENIDVNSGPKFVFAHIVSPHKPFVFGPNGEIVEWEPGYKVGYPNQINYLNIRVQKVIDHILNESETPPSIVLQGDHGARQFVGEEGRMAILNAYYLPGLDKGVVYDSISPVNTFRVIFNEYFDENFDLLPDISLYSSYLSPLDYTVIPLVGENCDQ